MKQIEIIANDMNGPVDEASSRVPRLREIKQNIIVIILKTPEWKLIIPNKRTTDYV